MRRAATALTVLALCVALGSSLGMSVVAASPGPSTPAADVAKSKKCPRGTVRKRVKLIRGRNKGKRVSRCVQKRKKPSVPRLSPI